MREASSKLLHPQFIERWSPRAMLSDPIPEADLMAMFEAAHWAPSCFNEQPWRFVFARSESDRKRFLPILVEANQVWARHAPVLVALFAKNYFNRDGSSNAWCEFDAGAAWMSLSLQALSRGYHCHAMGGFDRDMAYQICGVDPKHYRVAAMIAIGKRGDPNALPEDLKAIESPNTRNTLARVVSEGLFDSSLDEKAF